MSRSSSSEKTGLWTWLRVRLQIIGFVYIGLAFVAAATCCVLAAFGLMPWLAVDVAVSGQPVENAGMYLQLSGTGLLLAMAFFLPSSLRVLALENSHRSFTMTMEDVTRSYITAHKADRAGAFSMSSEFDAVRERMIFMREHPDLIGLEPALIDVAAQMSQASRDLAETYSDEKMARARSVLRQRQEELLDFQENLETAKKTTDEIRRWISQLEIEESITDTQVAQLKTDLAELLPGLGLKVIKAPKPAKAVAREIEVEVYDEGEVTANDYAKVVAMTSRGKDQAAAE